MGNVYISKGEMYLFDVDVRFWGRRRIPQFDIVIDTWGGQYRFVRVRSDTIDNSRIGLENGHNLASLAIPNKNVATIGTGHDVTSSPKRGFINGRPNQSTEWKIVKLEWIIWKWKEEQPRIAMARVFHLGIRLIDHIVDGDLFFFVGYSVDVRMFVTCHGIPLKIRISVEWIRLINK